MTPSPKVLCWLPLAALACGNSGTSARPDASAEDLGRRQLLAGLGEHVVLDTLATFAPLTDTLTSSVQTWCTALGTGTEDASREAAQDAWRAAMRSWQQAELMQVGPVAMDQGTLHARIYSWPLVSSCAVDQEVMTRRQDPSGHDLATVPTNRRGLPALEYLLFQTSLEHTCPPTAAPAGWSALPDADRKAARCAYATAAAGDLAMQAHTLLDAWSPAGGDYVNVLATAGEPGNPFASAREGLNAVSDALFYLDSEVKDMKLARPAGITINTCGMMGTPCPADLESRWAHHSRENVIANLQGLQRLYLGGAPGGTEPGFDDLLRSLNAADLATTLETDVAAALAAAEAIPGTLDDAITTAPQAVVDAHAAVKRVTDTLKSQFLTVLGLELPDELGDDTD